MSVYVSSLSESKDRAKLSSRAFDLFMVTTFVECLATLPVTPLSMISRLFDESVQLFYKSILIVNLQSIAETYDGRYCLYSLYSIL
jgi:hypothetical protein